MDIRCQLKGVVDFCPTLNGRDEWETS